MSIGNVVALIDGSIYSHSVAEHAAWAAQHYQVPAALVHVLGRRDTAIPSIAEHQTREDLMVKLREVTGQQSELLEAVGEAILAEAAEVAKSAGAPEVHRKLRHGDLVDVLQELEVDARMIVVGKRGAAADFAKLHLGSNIERVVRASRVNVLMASRAFNRIKRFLVAYDAGPSARKAIEQISRSPLFDHIEPHLLCVHSDPGEAEKRLADAQATLNWSGKVVSETASGDPEKVIADYVEQNGIDLVVMGAYGHSRVRNLLVGSTTSEMMRSCPVPVLVIR